MFGSWYRQPIIDRVSKKIGRAEYERQLRRVESFERLLTDDGLLLVKFWFHLPKKVQRKRAQAELRNGKHGSPFLQVFAGKYDEYVSSTSEAVRMTDTAFAPWTLVESTDALYRDLVAGRHLVSICEDRLRRTSPRPPEPEEARKSPGPGIPSVTTLDHIDLSQSLDDDRYDRRIEKLQAELGSLAWKARALGRFTMAVFEGWDAAGKGGAIRRATQAIDARLFKVISVGRPTDEEKAHHYLWRFWRHVPRPGMMTIYDRSWYGRVLVERVERLARPEEWTRAYAEINEFEQQLVEHGVVLVKFWIHISPEEQLARFRERERVEWKKHKITEEDWRNREKWSQYAVAVDEMCARTSTEHAPWTLIAGNDKRHARVSILDTFVERLKDALGD
jgi:polyphosphate:AMP phosphotransferase